MKRFHSIIGIILMIFVSVAAYDTLVLASTEGFEVYRGKVRVEIGNRKIKDTLLYNEATYIPLASLHSKFRQQMFWDENTNTVYIDNVNIDRDLPAYVGEWEVDYYHTTTIYFSEFDENEKVKATVENINVVVHNKQVSSDILLYNNRIYVPLREICNYLDIDLYCEWQGIFLYVYIGKHPETYIDLGRLENMEDISKALRQHFGRFDTWVQNDIEINFFLSENEDKTLPYDYCVRINCLDEIQLFQNVKYGIQFREEYKYVYYRELKALQEKIALSLITSMPDTKFYGGYHTPSWGGYSEFNCFTWVNFSFDGYDNFDSVSYADTVVNGFQWYNKEEYNSTNYYDK